MFKKKKLQRAQTRRSYDVHAKLLVCSSGGNLWTST